MVVGDAGDSTLLELLLPLDVSLLWWSLLLPATTLPVDNIADVASAATSDKEILSDFEEDDDDDEEDEEEIGNSPFVSLLLPLPPVG